MKERTLFRNSRIPIHFYIDRFRDTVAFGATWILTTSHRFSTTNVRYAFYPYQQAKRTSWFAIPAPRLSLGLMVTPVSPSFTLGRMGDGHLILSTWFLFQALSMCSVLLAPLSIGCALERRTRRSYYIATTLPPFWNAHMGRESRTPIIFCLFAAA